MSESRNSRLAQRMRQEIFVPALQRAVAEARLVNAAPVDMLNAVLAAFGDMLVTLIGKKATADLLRGYSEHLEKHAED